jgi:hypothetical protein
MSNPYKGLWGGKEETLRGIETSKSLVSCLSHLQRTSISNSRGFQPAAIPDMGRSYLRIIDTKEASEMTSIDSTYFTIHESKGYSEAAEKVTIF